MIAKRFKAGFTLVELLVVIGIMAVLISILLPALSRAREAVNEVKCASNMRQLATALMMYANDYKGKFPPYMVYNGNPAVFDDPTAPLKVAGSTPANAWWDAGRIGRYLPKTVLIGSGTNETANPDLKRVFTPVMTCPTYYSSNTAVRCYAMNWWACSKWIASLLNGNEHPNGRLFGVNARGSSQLILLGEAVVISPITGTGYPGGDGYSCNALIGYNYISGVAAKDFPAQLFGAGSVYWTYSGPPGTGTPDAKSNIAWFVHRRSGQSKAGAAGLTERATPYGRANFAFADGHVEMLSHTDCADFNTNKTTGRVLWSPKDPELVN